MSTPASPSPSTESVLHQELEALREEVSRLKAQQEVFRKTESELRQSRQMLRLVMDNIPQAIFWKDRDSVYLGCNQRFANAAGLSRPEHVVGKVDYDLPWTREEADWFRKCDAQVIEKDEPWVHIIETQTNAEGIQTWLDTNKVPLHGEDNSVVGVLGTFENITERVRMENELKEKNEALEKQAAALQLAQRELLKINEDLEERVRVRTQRIEEQNQKLNEALTGLRAAQQQLIQAEKMAALGMLTAGIAHELKNPLNFVNNFSQLTLEFADELREALVSTIGQVPPELATVVEDIRENMLRIHEHGTRADSIVRTMLLHSRGANGELQPTRLDSLLEECLRLAYHGFRAKDGSFNLTHHFDHDPTLGMIQVVPQSLSRAFLNILNNACYSVWEMVRRTPQARPPELRITSRRVGNQVEVRIHDNGLGVPKDKLEHIFEPFFTTKPAGEGTGLGLSICYDVIVKEHGGEIRIESTEGEYAELIVTLPLKETTP